ncbi:MAG: DUF4142 domain-containing protein [Verrucomicrobiota bacterium]
MTTIKNNQLRAAICRGLITAGLLSTGLALRAQQGSADQSKRDITRHDTASAHYGADAGDVNRCIQEAAKMNMATIQFGQLAAEKAENPELKRFAQTLQSDHQKAQTKLATIAQKHNVSLPTSLDAKCEEEMTKLRGLSGAEFDKEFAKGAVEGHAMALAHLQHASMQVKDSDLAQYMKDALAHVKEHQQRSREVAKAVGIDQATIASLESKAKEGVGTPGATSESSRGTSSDTSRGPSSDTPRGSGKDANQQNR